MRGIFLLLLSFASASLLFADIGPVRARCLGEGGETPQVEASCSVRRVSDGLFEIGAKAANKSGKPQKFKLVIEAETDFKPSRYLIPCVMYNGNEYGRKGLRYPLYHAEMPEQHDAERHSHRYFYHPQGCPPRRRQTALYCRTCPDPELLAGHHSCLFLLLPSLSGATSDSTYG